LLFHMLFGYLIVRAVLIVMGVVTHLPPWVGRRFARLLDAATTPFHAVNYWGSVVGARLIGRRRMDGRFDRVIASLRRRLAVETGEHLRRGMYFPRRWDPFFQEFMTFADVYRYPTQHFEFHRRQLTLDRADPADE